MAKKIIYYVNGKWRDGVLLSKEEYYQNAVTGLRSAKREWGTKYKNIKVRRNNDGSYRVYGQKKHAKNKSRS